MIFGLILNFLIISQFVHSNQFLSFDKDQTTAVTQREGDVYDSLTLEQNQINHLPLAGERINPLPDLKSPVRIKNNSVGLELTAGRALVIDAKSRMVLFEKNPDIITPIASITKLMSALVFLENNPGWEKEVVMKKIDERSGGKLNLFRGEKISVKDLFYVGLIGSDNNAITALVRSTGLDEKEFVNKMNQKAKDFNMKSSDFVEPTGLSSLNISTARDVLVLVEKAFSNANISKVVKIKKYDFTSLNNINHTIYNTDLLLNSFLDMAPYKVIGGKTGYTEEAGYCLTAQVKNNEKSGEVLAVVLGADSPQNRFNEIKGLVTWVFENYRF